MLGTTPWEAMGVSFEEWKTYMQGLGWQLSEDEEEEHSQCPPLHGTKDMGHPKETKRPECEPHEHAWVNMSFWEHPDKADYRCKYCEIPKRRK